VTFPHAGPGQSSSLAVERFVLADEREQQDEFLESADVAVRPQHGIGAESYDRIDVERDLRKP
jgi:hypothetical protein